jgi:hypothetical protein
MLAGAVVLLVAAALIRVHAAIAALVMMAPWLFEIRPAPPRRVVAAFFAALAVAGTATIADSLYYDARPEWRDWLVYNRARAELHDRPQFRTLTPATLREVELAGWSPLEARLFWRWVFFDPDLYGTERLHRVARAVAHRLPSLRFAWRDLRHRLARQSLAVQVGLPLLLGLCFGRRRGAYLGRAGISMLLLLAFALWLLQSYKLEPRWLRAIIDVLPIASMLWLAGPVPAARPRDRWLRAGGLVVMLVYAGAQSAALRQQLLTSEQNARTTWLTKEGLARLTTYAAQAGRRGEPIVFLTLGRSIQPERLSPLDDIAVLRDAPILRFGWLTHSPHYRAMLERHGLGDVYTDVVDRDDILLVSDPATVRLFVEFLRQRRGRSVEADALPDFPELQQLTGAQVYRIRTRAVEPDETAGGRSRKLAHGVDDGVLILDGEIVVEGQAEQAVAEVFGDRAVAVPAAESAPHLGEVQRQVVKHGQDAAPLEMIDQRTALRQRRQQQVVHVVGLPAVRGHDRRPHARARAPVAQLGVVELPQRSALALDRVAGFELGTEKRRQDVGHDVARSDVDPRVLVHLAAEHGAAVGAFFSNDFRSVDMPWLVEQ